MQESKVIKPWDLANITKGKIGEWIARDYYRCKGYVVWFLEYYSREGHFYSGTGKEHVNDKLVLTPWEKAILANTRDFDLLVIPKEDVNKAKTEANKYGYIYGYFEIFQEIFVRILREEGFEGLINLATKKPNELREFVEHKLRDWDAIFEKRLRESSWYKCFLECLKRLEEFEIEELSSEEFELKIREYRPDRGFIETRISLTNWTSDILELWRIKSIEKWWIDCWNYWQELKKLKRVLVDVKTKWSRYEYPDSVKKKNIKLINLLKLLGFECEVLELDFSTFEIKVSSLKL